MMVTSQFLANRSGGKIPGRFAKIARTLKNQYFYWFGRMNRTVGNAFSPSKFDTSTEVCQNDGWNPFTAVILQPAVANIKSRSPGLKRKKNRISALR